MDFLVSIAIIIICSLFLGAIFKKVKLPSLLAMILIGIIMGPYVLDIIAPDLLLISADLRTLALVIILIRAGLSLDLKELRKNSRSAILLCFLPALFEIGGYLIFGCLFLNIDLIDCALLGSVMAAVSPAVVIPRMLKIKEEGYGVDKAIPQMLTIGASFDDVFVIILFTTFLNMSSSKTFSLHIIWEVPVSIILGILVGIVIGYIAKKALNYLSLSQIVKVIIILCISILFIALETLIGKWIPYAPLLSIISMGAMFYKDNRAEALKLEGHYKKLWLVAEIFLFVLVGAAVDIKYAFNHFGILVLVIILALLIRMIGVYICLLGSKLNFKERFFCAVAYLPKATVQAAIGAIALSLGIASGSLILAAAVIAIIITAPLGAFLIDISYKKLLNQIQTES